MTAFHMVHLAHAARPRLPNWFLLRSNAEWGMFKTAARVWIPDREAIHLERSDLLPLSVFCSQLSAAAHKQPASDSVHSTGNLRQRRLKKKKKKRKCEHDCISVRERYFLVRWGNKNNLDKCKSSARLTSKVKNHVGITPNTHTHTQITHNMQTHTNISTALSTVSYTYSMTKTKKKHMTHAHTFKPRRLPRSWFFFFGLFTTFFGLLLKTGMLISM